ncbi:hypothetical protein GCM10025331_78000 [Actinoplanes utahensis]|uniref:Uncharacterized protein n=1 Tax=Actinoplanes utahensis TaxID=1869 RepID=A0A0A6UIM9_ACTUT|nr:hypothetical protein MB27_20140 [Actinoplanes utahensis]GIF35056.1 hypothetical protein Aut01nite_80420 [Actinoplanes utahensis]
MQPDTRCGVRLSLFPRWSLLPANRVSGVVEDPAFGEVGKVPGRGDVVVQDCQAADRAHARIHGRGDVSA